MLYLWEQPNWGITWTIVWPEIFIFAMYVGECSPFMESIHPSWRVFTLHGEYSVFTESIQYSRIVFSIHGEYSVFTDSIQYSRRVFSLHGEYSPFMDSILPSRRVCSLHGEYSPFMDSILPSWIYTSVNTNSGIPSCYLLIMALLLREMQYSLFVISWQRDLATARTCLQYTRIKYIPFVSILASYSILYILIGPYLRFLSAHRSMPINLFQFASLYIVI